VHNLMNCPGCFGFVDKTETFADELGLPRSVELLTSSKSLTEALKTFYKGQSGMDVPADSPQLKTAPGAGRRAGIPIYRDPNHQVIMGKQFPSRLNSFKGSFLTFANGSFATREKER